MEIVKQNCNYSISDTLENGWKVSGSVTKEASGTIYINYSISDELGADIGNYSYSKYSTSSDRVSINYSVSETNKSDFVRHSDEIITEVLSNIND